MGGVMSNPLDENTSIGYSSSNKASLAGISQELTEITTKINDIVSSSSSTPSSSDSNPPPYSNNPPSYNPNQPLDSTNSFISTSNSNINNLVDTGKVLYNKGNVLFNQSKDFVNKGKNISNLLFKNPSNTNTSSVQAVQPSTPVINPVTSNKISSIFSRKGNTPPIPVTVDVRKFYGDKTFMFSFLCSVYSRMASMNPHQFIIIIISIISN